MWDADYVLRIQPVHLPQAQVYYGDQITKFMEIPCLPASDTHLDWCFENCCPHPQYLICRWQGLGKPHGCLQRQIQEPVAGWEEVCCSSSA
jgi:hypothetical protein